MTMLTLDREQMAAFLEKDFSPGQRVRLVVTGSSMEPFLRHLRDSVILIPVKECNPRMKDIVFFQRKDGTWVLHRVIGRDKSGSYVINGDAQTWVEHIRKEQILACAGMVIRKEKVVNLRSLSYRTYTFVWGLLRPLRKVIFQAAGALIRQKKSRTDL